MGAVFEMSLGGLWKRWNHKLFHCWSFWKLRRRYECPICGHRYRCYWDGNDTHGMIDVCNKCAKKPTPTKERQS